MAELDLKGLLDMIGRRGAESDTEMGLLSSLSTQQMIDADIPVYQPKIQQVGKDPEKPKGATSDSESDATVRFLRSQGQHNLADMVESGAMTASAAMQLGIRSLTESGYGAMSEKEMQQYPIQGWTNMGDTPEIQQFINSLPEDLLLRVEEYRGAVSDEDFQKKIRELMSVGGGNKGAMSGGDFQRYNRDTNLQNLGFVGGGY